MLRALTRQWPRAVWCLMRRCPNSVRDAVWLHASVMMEMPKLGTTRDNN